MNRLFPTYHCKEASVDVILPTKDIKPDESNQWLIIGYPGVDGIEFRVKLDKQESAIYAFYPIDDEHIKIANSPNDLIQKWMAKELIL
ncbi:MAG: hypothetical protein AAF944_01860 [Bacteroidota bacterium]